MHKIIINSKILSILIKVLNRRIKKYKKNTSIWRKYKEKKTYYICNKINYENAKNNFIININDNNDNYTDFNNIII